MYKNSKIVFVKLFDTQKKCWDEYKNDDSASKRFESESAPSQAKKRQNAPQFFFQKNATIFT